MLPTRSWSFHEHPRNCAACRPWAGPRRRRRAISLIAALACLTLLGGSAFGVRDTGERLAHGVRDALGARPAAPASPAPAATNAAATKRRDAVEALFNARSRAVLTRDKVSFLSLVDATATRFRARQERLFDQLVKVPFASWSYHVIGDGPALSLQRKRALPAGSWILRVTLFYTFEGASSPVERAQFFTLKPRGDIWLLAEDRDAAVQDAALSRDIWDLGEIAVVRGAKSLVIGVGSSARLQRFASVADRAVREVDKVWRSAWTHRAVVIVPRTQADMATIINADISGLDQIAAVTTGHSHSGPTRGDRVVVNPKAWRELTLDGRNVVMTHEVTHLATRANTWRAIPMWVSEGFADYVAYSAVDVSDRVVAQDILAQVRSGNLPSVLPRDSQFNAANGELGPAYEGAWLVCRMIAQTYGEDQLIELYLRLGDKTPLPVDAELRSVLRVSEAELIADWQLYLKDMANR